MQIATEMHPPLRCDTVCQSGGKLKYWQKGPETNYHSYECTLVSLKSVQKRQGFDLLSIHDIVSHPGALQKPFCWSPVVYFWGTERDRARKQLFSTAAAEPQRISKWESVTLQLWERQPTISHLPKAMEGVGSRARTRTQVILAPSPVLGHYHTLKDEVKPAGIWKCGSRKGRYA